MKCECCQVGYITLIPKGKSADEIKLSEQTRIDVYENDLKHVWQLIKKRVEGPGSNGSPFHCLEAKTFKCCPECGTFINWEGFAKHFLMNANIIDEHNEHCTCFQCKRQLPKRKMRAVVKSRDEYLCPECDKLEGLSGGYGY